MVCIFSGSLLLKPRFSDKDDLTWGEVFFDSFFPGVIRPAGQEEAKEFDRFGKPDVIAQAAGLMAESLCQMGLSHAGGTIEQDMLSLFDKSASAKIPDELVVDFGVEGEVKPLDGFFLLERGSTEAKREFLAFPSFDLVLNKRRIDDKDHYSNKRLKLAGDLMEDLFRISLNRLTRDIKYQLERASMRHRDLSIATAVRADVLTERLLHPLATGNWVGGRTGVSQLLDRVDHMAVLSHLRRVISPLSRSQPHFEARDLHPTQWGRICPSETPEGPNCGLVKNFAQMVEISKGVDDEAEVMRLLYNIGVEQIRGEIR